MREPADVLEGSAKKAPLLGNQVAAQGTASRMDPGEYGALGRLRIQV